MCVFVVVCVCVCVCWGGGLSHAGSPPEKTRAMNTPTCPNGGAATRRAEEPRAGIAAVEPLEPHAFAGLGGGGRQTHRLVRPNVPGCEDPRKKGGTISLNGVC